MSRVQHLFNQLAIKHRQIKQVDRQWGERFKRGNSNMISHLEISMYSACIYSAVLTYTPNMYWRWNTIPISVGSFWFKTKEIIFQLAAYWILCFLSLSLSPHILMCPFLLFSFNRSALSRLSWLFLGFPLAMGVSLTRLDVASSVQIRNYLDWRLPIVRLTIQYGVTITAFEIVCYCYASV